MTVIVLNGRTWYVVSGVVYRTRQAALEALAGSR